MFRIGSNYCLRPPLIALQASNLFYKVIARLRMPPDNCRQACEIVAYLIGMYMRQPCKAFAHFHIDALCRIKICVFQRALQRILRFFQSYKMRVVRTQIHFIFCHASKISEIE